ncbi:MAG: metal ABC transporter permease [Pirellulales bacterium]|nr:metal ABC transporter permease [Pirellulales bacterium]
MRSWMLIVVTLLVWGGGIGLALAAPHEDAHQAIEHAAKPNSLSLVDHRLSWPDSADVWRVVSLRDYNTRIVLAGTMLLGVVGGVVGTFMLLRKRALAGDVVGHASLPGIATAFIVMESISPGSGKSLPGLLTGALIAGACGLASVLAIRRLTRIKEDAALAIVLSVFFGFGIVLFTVVQSIPSGGAAGLQGFIFGKAASLVAADVNLISAASLVVLVICTLLFKELSLVCFDENYAAAEGWPVTWLDLVLMSLVAAVSVIGLQSVGLLLVVAMLIIPPSAARFWTDDLRRMTLVAALLGGASAAVGALGSALFPRLAAGAVIVLAGALAFGISLLFGTKRGFLHRLLADRRLRQEVAEQHLLRGCYELLEAIQPVATAADLADRPISMMQLLDLRSWNFRRLQQVIARAEREGLVELRSRDVVTLTRAGAVEAQRVVRNHRLWELYLINYADVAPSRVDRSADRIEHVLEPEVMRKLEETLRTKYPRLSDVPPSPHAMG